MTMLEIALSYAARGWHVFPVHVALNGRCSCNRDCRNPGKHPRTKNGLLDATTDEATIRRWWGMWGGTSNIGIATGPSGLLVVDIDPRHGGDEAFRDLIADNVEAWQKTPTVLTGGGGQHYYYQAPDVPMRNSTGALGSGIDIRGDGGYVIAPPSVHVSGHEWEWEVGPDECELAPYPGPTSFSKERRASASGIEDIIPEGHRDQALTSIAGSLRQRGHTEGEILALLRETNLTRCKPPLNDGDLQRIAQSVARYEPGRAIPARLVREAPPYANLRKILTRPPMYVLAVHGQDIKLTLSDLDNHRTVRKIALGQADVRLSKLTDAEWDRELRRLLDDMERVERPVDATDDGWAWEEVREWVMASAVEDEEALSKRRVWARDNEYLVSGPALREALKQKGFVLDANAVWDLLRDHGAVNSSIRAGDSVRNAWRIPAHVIAGSREAEVTESYNV